ncbi:C4-dicarboxylate ABC transporter [Natronospirillum operosum]|uniref:C4-dicarboxylate ABC transporter n=1 Tax=Natronospirillum operosum TaxID=2759953 RepID=A0A4Z0WI47_9GAMM|nr:TRAP transporter substrate-binding protein DctP [Natronospirillum operosum]TGG95301.1 C4-dicarboxylate ABC transporter [Natronospirillum operosum]
MRLHRTRSPALALLLLSLTLFAAAGTVAMELRIATLLPDGTGEVRALRQASERLSAETDGRVTLRIFPGGVMGDDQAVERRIRAGQLHGSLVQSGALARVYPNVQILNAPFIFDSYDETDRLRAEFDDDIARELAERGIHTFGFIDGGFAYVMGHQPTRSVEDLQRARVWLPANDTFSLQVARAFGVSPITLNISEVLTSLQTGIVDTIMAPPTAALTLQWFTRVDYITDMPLIYTYATLYVHDRHMSRLSEDDRAAVDRILRETTEQIDANARENNRAAFEALLNQGLEHVQLTDTEIAAVRDKAGLAHEVLIREGEFSRDWHERLMSTLEDYRQNGR